MWQPQWDDLATNLGFRAITHCPLFIGLTCDTALFAYVLCPQANGVIVLYPNTLVQVAPHL